MADQFTFKPTSYQPFQTATGYGYDDWLAQMRDSLSTPTRGAGIFGNNGGNNMPRYAFGNREGSMHPGSGFNASSFLAPYLAAIQPPGGGGGAPVPGGSGAPPVPPPAAGPMPAPPLQPGIPPIPGAPPQGTPLPGGGMGAGGLLGAGGYGQPVGVGPESGIRTAIPAGAPGYNWNGVRGGLLGTQAQSPLAAFLASLLTQQNQSGPGGMRGAR
jgi:hypothetical protein